MGTEEEEHKEALNTIRKFPVQFYNGLEPSMRSSFMHMIASMMYEDGSASTEMIKEDEALSLRIWSFIVDGISSLLREGGFFEPDRAKVKKATGHTTEDLRVGLMAAMNFLASHNQKIPVQEYSRLVTAFEDVWYTARLDAYEDLPFSLLQTFTTDIARCEHLVEEKLLDVTKLIDRATKSSFQSMQFFHIISTVQNLSRLHSVVRLLITQDSDDIIFLDHLIGGLDPKYPEYVRAATSGLLKNMSMFQETHPALLDPEKDFLSSAVRPLVGDGSYDEEEMMNLPTLTYGILLNKEVKRDRNFEVRKNTLELVFQLCSNRTSRESLRQQSIYCVLREYHKWEENEELLDLVERVVNLIIQTEDEIGLDNFKDIKV